MSLNDSMTAGSQQRPLNDAKQRHSQAWEMPLQQKPQDMD